MESRKNFSQIFKYTQGKESVHSVTIIKGSQNIHNFTKVLSQNVYFEQNAKNHKNFLP